MKKQTHWIIGAFSALGIVVGLLSTSFIYASKDDKNANWLSKIDDSRTLTSLSLPGSHDCGATHSILDLAGKCQDASIYSQLLYGTRYLDVRLKGNNDSLYIYHGFIAQNLSFESLLDDCEAFLSKYPSETILVSIKEEQDLSNCSKGFESLLKESIASRPFITDSFPSSLGEARGKMVLLSRYKDSTIGVPSYQGWEDPSSPKEKNTFDILTPLVKMHIQDHYKLNDCDSKWSEVLEAVDYAKNNLDVLTLNFLSGYLVSSFPPSYSLSVAKDINKRISSLPNDSKGVMIMDFVTAKTCEEVLRRNF